MNKAETLASTTFDTRSIDCARIPTPILVAQPFYAETHSLINKVVHSEHELATTKRSSVPTNVYAFPRSKGAFDVPEISMPEGLKIDCDQEAWNFAESKDLLPVLMSYTALAAKAFQLTGFPSCQFKQDPENDDRYLSIRLEVKGEVEEVLDAEDRFRSQLIDLISGEKLYLLRLAYVID
jgi:hypothetical protein